MKEVKWQIIEDAPRYMVSTEGEVKNKSTGRLLSPGQNPNGYLKVTLTVNEPGMPHKVKQFYIHRLVAKAFIPNEEPNIYTQVNHKDECKTNNDWTNLEWCSPKYNINYGTSKKRRQKTIQEKLDNCEYGCGNIVYAYDAQTKKFIGKYGSQRDAARKLNCDAAAISRIINPRERAFTCKGMIFFSEPQNFDND